VVYYGPAYYYGPAWYGPGWGAPYGYYRGPVTGGVKFDTKMEDAQCLWMGLRRNGGKIENVPTAAGLVQYRTCAIMTAISFYQERTK